MLFLLYEKKTSCINLINLKKQEFNDKNFLKSIYSNKKLFHSEVFLF